jgi:hypothetical protein
MLRAVLPSLLAVLIGACVLAETEDELPPGCGRRSSVLDGGRCHCTSDCLAAADGGVCLDEVRTGMPGGLCARECATNADCDSGFECDSGFCSPRCTSGDECEAGRACTPTTTAGTSTCSYLCDEASDCESGRCNVYSNLCLGDGEVPTGAALNAHCAGGAECQSGLCVLGACMTRCDPATPRCPEDGVCVFGMCMTPCTTTADCSGSATCTALDGDLFCL